MDLSPLFTLRKYSHFFLVLNPTTKILGLLHTFCMRYAQKEYVREHGMRYPTLKVTKVFAARTKDNSEFRLHIGQLEPFLKFLEDHSIPRNLYKVEEVPLYQHIPLDTSLREGWVLKDYQEKIVNYIDTPNDIRSRLVALPTGKGKTVSSLAAAAQLKCRIVVAVLPKYINKWYADVKGILNVNGEPILDEDILIVQGSVQLRKLIMMAKCGEFDAAVTIISITTLQNYYKLYEDNPALIEEQGYDCAPQELFETLGAGLLLIDETHQHIHAVFKIMLYTHIPLIVALSATLLATDPIVESIHRIMYPFEIRFDEIKPDKYIKVYAVDYRFHYDNFKFIKTTEYGTSNYSHMAFEKSILRRPWLQKSYFEMIDYFVRKSYLEEKMNGDKLAIFVSTIALATLLTEWLKKKYPNLDIRRYVEKDPYTNVIDADIRITTPLSAGTALDIPNLRAIIQTISVKSPIQNIQNLGRLRELKDRDTKFYYLYCNQIPKQVQYHRERKELYADRVATIKDYPYHKEL